MKLSKLRNKKFMITAVLVFNTVICTAALTVAWFVDTLSSPVRGEASISKTYFEGGDGTVAHPYQIKYPIQFYYFTWLQDMGFFNHQDGTSGAYQQYHFELIGDIDMSNYNLPPAGSDKYPFIGSFEGNGHTISNLHIVNSNYTDTPENPNSDDRNYQIMGAFGVVGAYGNMPYTFNSAYNYVTNVTLNNVTINSTSPKEGKVLIGLAAGYVNGANTISNVQVGGTSSINSSNATGTLSTLTNKLSDHALVGYFNNTQLKYLESADVKKPVISNKEGDDSPAIIDDNPGIGGDLVISPENFPNSVSSGNTQAVPGAIAGTAYFVGQVAMEQQKGGSPTFKYGNRDATFTPNPNADNYRAQVKVQEAYQYYINHSRYYLASNSTPPTGSGSGYPGNGTWFKPIAPGIASLAFAIANKGGTKAMAIYKYSRLSNGNYSYVSKTEFNLPSAYGNGTIVYFEYEITAADVAAGYEYVIGAANGSSLGKAAGFVAMALAGTDPSAGVIKPVTDSDHAVYEQIIYGANSINGINGASFVGDSFTTFQLNTPSQNYTFVASENNAAINQSPGIGTHVSRPTQSSISSTTLQVITGYATNGALKIIMKKSIVGSTATYSYSTDGNTYTDSNELAMGRFFGSSASNNFSTTTELKYYYQIANSSAVTVPNTSLAVTANSASLTINTYTVTCSANKNDVVIETTNVSGHSLIFNGTDGRIYPAN